MTTGLDLNDPPIGATNKKNEEWYRERYEKNVEGLSKRWDEDREERLNRWYDKLGIPRPSSDPEAKVAAVAQAIATWGSKPVRDPSSTLR